MLPAAQDYTCSVAKFGSSKIYVGGGDEDEEPEAKL